MKRNIPAAALLAAGLSLLLAACSATATDEDFASAAARSRALIEGLQAYEIEATMTIENISTEPQQVPQMDIALNAAGRWPDRLANRQEGQGFLVDLGTGADGAWLHIGQLGTCYMGPAAELTRDLNTAQDFALTEASVFNFYSGIAQFMLPAAPEAVGETGRETVTVDGRDVPCLVFTFAAAEGDPAPGAPREGERTAWYDPASGLVLKSRRTVSGERGGVTMSQTITTVVDRYELDGTPADERFGYTPPATVRTVDTFEKILNPDSMAGQTAPDITLRDFDGAEVKVSDFRGKVLFLNFWATWCGPCRMEMPHIQTLYEEMEPQGEVVFLGVSSEEAGTITGFLEKNPYTFRMLMARPQDVAGPYATRSIPAIFVIDTEGVIRAHLIGAQSEAQMRSALAKAGVGG